MISTGDSSLTHSHPVPTPARDPLLATASGGLWDAGLRLHLLCGGGDGGGGGGGSGGGGGARGRRQTRPAGTGGPEPRRQPLVQGLLRHGGSLALTAGTERGTLLQRTTLSKTDTTAQDGGFKLSFCANLFLYCLI